MIAFGHTAVGVLVGIGTYQVLGGSNVIEGSAVAFSVGVASHYLFDFIPHGHFFGPKDYKRKVFLTIIFDLLLSLILFTYLSFTRFGISDQFFYILFAIAGSQAPDILDGFIYIDILPNKGLIKAENNLHRLMHWHGKDKNTLLISRFDIWQVLICLSAVFFIFNT